VFQDLFIGTAVKLETMQEHGDRVCSCVLGSGNQHLDWRMFVRIHWDRLRDVMLPWLEDRGRGCSMSNLGSGVHGWWKTEVVTAVSTAGATFACRSFELIVRTIQGATFIEPDR